MALRERLTALSDAARLQEGNQVSIQINAYYDIVIEMCEDKANQGWKSITCQKDVFRECTMHIWNDVVKQLQVEGVEVTSDNENFTFNWN